MRVDPIRLEAHWAKGLASSAHQECAAIEQLWVGSPQPGLEICKLSILVGRRQRLVRAQKPQFIAIAVRGPVALGRHNDHRPGRPHRLRFGVLLADPGFC